MKGAPGVFLSDNYLVRYDIEDANAILTVY